MANRSISEDQLILVAELYYREGLSQQEIAEKLGCSRTNVARMLKICVDTGIVEFRIKRPASGIRRMEYLLEQLFSLEKAILVPDQGPVLDEVGEAAAKYLDLVLRDGMVIGMPYGSAVCRVAERFRPSCPKKADVVQLIGGLSVSEKEFDGQYIVKLLQSKLQGSAHVLQAPLVVSNEEARKVLMEELEIKNHFEVIKRADIAVVGIGSEEPSLSAIYKAGHITGQEAQNIYRQGAVADICSIPVDACGRACKTSISGRVIGISLEELDRIPIRIGCAAGQEKAPAILAALRGGHISVLVTDESAASKILAFAGPTDNPAFS